MSRTDRTTEPIWHESGRGIGILRQLLSQLSHQNKTHSKQRRLTASLTNKENRISHHFRIASQKDLSKRNSPQNIKWAVSICQSVWEMHFSSHVFDGAQTVFLGNWTMTAAMNYISICRTEVTILWRRNPVGKAHRIAHVNVRARKSYVIDRAHGAKLTNQRLSPRVQSQ